jgi:hypothetical protein
MVEEEAMEVGKTWRKVERFVVGRKWWKLFTDALLSRRSDRN